MKKQQKSGYLKHDVILCRGRSYPDELQTRLYCIWYLNLLQSTALLAIIPINVEVKILKQRGA